MKKKAIVLISCFLVLISLGIVYILAELFNEDDINEAKMAKANQNALKFKKEYEELNDDEHRNISIPEDNPFIYKTEDDIVKAIEDKETFIVYFGFAKCPWCRSVLETAITSAKEHKIDKIYYVDVLNIRDKYELNDKNKAVKTVEGTEGYNKLLTLLDNVLSDYSPLTYTVKKKTKTVKINEKRIYAPNFVMVKNGEPFKLEEGISDKQTDSMMELTDDIKCEMKEKFDCFFDLFNQDAECSKDTKC